MAALLLPTPLDGYPDESLRVQLDGVSFVIRWLWNSRGAYWAFSLADGDGSPIISGVRVSVGTDLLARCADERRPIGPLIVVDPSHGNSDPGRDELGQRVKVAYLDAETWL